MPTALDILIGAPWDPGKNGLIVLVGDEPFLAGEVLARLRRGSAGGVDADPDRAEPCPRDAGDWGYREFDGHALDDARDVFDEAATIPLFGGSPRVAVVRGADAFVTANRERLETLAGRDRGAAGLVVLEVKSLPSNTRLAKAVAARNAQIDLAVPPKYDLVRWLADWAQRRHGRCLAKGTGERLLDRLAGDLGRIDQSLARMAAVGEGPIPPEAVDDAAGSPRDRTAWSMIDAAAAGDAPQAIGRLAELLDAGESPIALAAQASTVLRRLATAARLLAMPVAAGRPADIEDALRQAGVPAWPKALQQARHSLTRLGPRRALALPRWLHELDRALKGASSRGPRAGLALETLFCRLAGADARRANLPAAAAGPPRPGPKGR